MESAPTLRRMADAAVRAGRFPEAADLYRREAAIYRGHGDYNGAKVEEGKANRYSSDLQLFAHPPKGVGTTTPSRPLAKYEPPTGCYVGAFIDRDERMGQKILDEADQAHYDPSVFAQAVGKKHASVFWYLSYGKPFPASWVMRLRDQQVASHIAWEPNSGLDAVQDDDYLTQFAQMAGETGAPIFLRFASEMNGSWAPYSGDPLLYRRKWGLVQQTMARWAPNVAMVWCVNSIPEEPISRYYPGDRYVDWVGVNCYSVPYHDNDPRLDATFENPADLIRFVYDNYARSKPIMVCEYGAAHVGAADGRDRSPWAARKIAEMYAALPRLYPRVKAINVYDMNNIIYADPGRQLSNYSLTDSALVLNAYANAVRSPYFLSTIGDGSAPAAPVPLTPGAAVPPRFARNGILRVSAWARCYSDRFTVRYVLDNREVFRSSDFGSFEALIYGAGSGARTLVATLTDDRGNLAARRQYRL